MCVSIGYLERRRCDPRKRQHILRDNNLRLAQDRITERDVHAERLAVELARELALRTETKPVVVHAVVLNVWMVLIGAHFERHEVAEVAASRLLQFGQNTVG
jgi:hypothetical protein